MKRGSRSSVGNTTVKPNELARCVLRRAMEGERDPAQLHDDALKGVIPATAWARGRLTSIHLLGESQKPKRVSREDARLRKIGAANQKIRAG
jgi:hypothetical protein